MPSEFNTGFKNFQSVRDLECLLQSEDRKLQADDIGYVKNIYEELLSNIGTLSRMKCLFKIEKVDDIIYRIILYISNEIEIRINLFLQKDENIIHQHGQSFITTCLAGGYKHCIYMVEESDSDYYVFHRKEKGVFQNVGQKKGTWKKLCSQPFDVNQSLYIAPQAFHTIEITKYPLVTFLVRDTVDTIHDVKFISTTTELENLPLIHSVSNDMEIDKIFNLFLQSLQNSNLF